MNTSKPSTDSENKESQSSPSGLNTENNSGVNQEFSNQSINQTNRTMAEPTSVNSQITDAITQSNITSIGSQPGELANLALSNMIMNVNLSQQNAVSNQQAMNQITIAILANV